MDDHDEIGDSVLLPHLFLTGSDVISIVGSGGKTTLMYILARELSDKGKRVITTTTTKIFPPHPSQSSRLLVSDREDVLLNKTHELLQQEKHLTLAEGFVGQKLKGVSPTLINRMYEQEIADAIIVEADGARQCPLKAPNETEPVIPSSTTLTVPVVGLDGIGKPNTEEYVFRPHYFSQLTGIKEGELVSAESVSRVILHPEGLRRGTPEKARVLPILNKGEIEGGLEVGTRVAQCIVDTKDRSIARVLITRLIPFPRVLKVFYCGQAV
ncbi:MAG TPA: selenium cofactor biosynthesis protein YqeC [Thermodesulfobacteriota bacterium]|nr:putative selenium-dependent hydroxylase accessory protein YqeC [Deltaproteobacteria bacterium]HQO79103.1 selenium cofactor biosynthesis protein YqeC [Thermodesulfobacteriota bacterium]